MYFIDDLGKVVLTSRQERLTIMDLSAVVSSQSSQLCLVPAHIVGYNGSGDFRANKAVDVADFMEHGIRVEVYQSVGDDMWAVTVSQDGSRVSRWRYMLEDAAADAAEELTKRLARKGVEV